MDSNTMMLAGIATVLSGFLAYIFKEIPRQIFFRILQMTSSSISVLSINDEDYIFLNQWLNKINNKLLNKHIELKEMCTREGDLHIPSIGYGNYFCRLGTLQYMNVKKHRVENNLWSHDEIVIDFFGINNKKLFKDLMTSINNRTKDIIKVYTNNPYYYIPEPKKNFEQIFSPYTKVIKNTIDVWVRNEEVYKRSGEPYKLGILLYGPPGTGKTTFAKAIATYLNYNLHSIALNDYDKAKELSERVMRIPSNSVVLLDEVDTMIKSREEIQKMDSDVKKEYEGYLQTLNGILDGAVSPNKVVFVATTNEIEKLDYAFKRDGRFDLKLNIGYMSKEDAIDMCKSYNIPVDKLDNLIRNINKLENPITPSTVKKLIFDNLR